MKTNVGNAKEIRDEALAGVAVVLEDVQKADELLAGINSDETLSIFEGNRFKTFAALSEGVLLGLADFEATLDKSKLRHCLALAVPVNDLQTEPRVEKDGTVTRTFCSANGLPFRTVQEKEDGGQGSGYKFRFVRPCFWLTRLVIGTNGRMVFYGTLFGQYRNSSNGQLEYRPVTKKSFEDNVEIEKPITRGVDSREQASKEFHCDERFLFAMVKSVTALADSQRRRQGLLESVNRTPVGHLTANIGETFPGLEGLKAKLEAQAAAKPDKKANKKAKRATKQEKPAEPVAAE